MKSFFKISVLAATLLCSYAEDSEPKLPEPAGGYSLRQTAELWRDARNVLKPEALSTQREQRKAMLILRLPLLAQTQLDPKLDDLAEVVSQSSLEKQQRIAAIMALLNSVSRTTDEWRRVLTEKYHTADLPVLDAEGVEKLSLNPGTIAIDVPIDAGDDRELINSIVANTLDCFASVRPIILVTHSDSTPIRIRIFHDGRRFLTTSYLVDTLIPAFKAKQAYEAQDYMLGLWLTLARIP